MKNRDLRKTKDLNPNIHINIAVVLAGGSGKRMKMKGSKQLIMIDDLPVFRHSVDLFKNLSEIHHVIVVYNPDYEREFQRWCSDIENISLVKCGDERYKSSFNALQYIDENFQNVNRVLIHDGARPFVKKELATRLLEFTCSTDCGVIPVIPVKDTIKRVEDGKVIKTPPRKMLFKVQTPQVFDFNTIFGLYRRNKEWDDITDDSMLFEKYGKDIYTVVGDEGNIKITTKQDLGKAGMRN